MTRPLPLRHGVHRYVENPETGRCVTCGTPEQNRHHEVPDTHEADAAHRLRTGEKD